MVYKSLHTLQISSPWKPPATIKFSLTVIVLIWTLDNDWDKTPGRFCSRDQDQRKRLNLSQSKNFSNLGLPNDHIPAWEQFV